MEDFWFNSLLRNELEYVHGFLLPNTIYSIYGLALDSFLYEKLQNDFAWDTKEAHTCHHLLIVSSEEDIE